MFFFAIGNEARTAQAKHTAQRIKSFEKCSFNMFQPTQVKENKTTTTTNWDRDRKILLLFFQRTRFLLHLKSMFVLFFHILKPYTFILFSFRFSLSVCLSFHDRHMIPKRSNEQKITSFVCDSRYYRLLAIHMNFKFDTHGSRDGSFCFYFSLQCVVTCDTCLHVFISRGKHDRCHSNQ